eukprot:TRINITY_DN14744_c0_g1_i1.p3 TRINITY_DN14744_c0_g1~~TRINITY_DN14744_c0_g1_i1.p3  ORF type:complete len:126 (+),score=28.91 TRINITY_DN14744_c0_g1_i1:52-429(+)
MSKRPAVEEPPEAPSSKTPVTEQVGTEVPLSSQKTSNGVSSERMEKLTLLYFAAAREAAGVAEEQMEVPAGTTADELRELLADRHPELRPLLAVALIAVNAEYATAEQVLEHRDEVAVIPPVSGG